MKARKAENGDMENVKQVFTKLLFGRMITKEDVEVRLIDKIQGSDPTKREYY